MYPQSLLGHKTQRSIENFKIARRISNKCRKKSSKLGLSAKQHFNKTLMCGYFYLKRNLISSAQSVDEILEGKFDAQFPLVVWQNR
jgi:fumarate hydratase class II